MIVIELQQDMVPERERFTSEDMAQLSRLTMQIPKYIPGTIAVQFVTDDRIRTLNRIYRHKDAVTDVLSFPYHLTAGSHLGDIVIAYHQAVRQSDGGDIRLEITDLLIHGILHILGYDHEIPEDAKIMFDQQDRLVQQLV